MRNAGIDRAGDLASVCSDNRRLQYEFIDSRELAARWGCQRHGFGSGFGVGAKTRSPMCASASTCAFVGVGLG
jgi:hypothetical protein